MSEQLPSLEEIPGDECWRLIAGHSVGRFAVARPGRSPLVVPVNYVVDGECIVFSSDPGTKLALLTRRPVSLQVDWLDPFHRTGWSVLIEGSATEVVRDEITQVELSPWVGERSHWVRLVAVTVTGRRIRLPDVPRDPRGYL